ncbi:unnamed protein product [Meloidogyne enterolobii]|uniref:Uncharacterized protein n=1 Tax=Meloidogyne enterolobii TaxID=390850 RepID=A0ACB0YVV3_MELEN
MKKNKMGKNVDNKLSLDKEIKSASNLVGEIGWEEDEKDIGDSEKNIEEVKKEQEVKEERKKEKEGEKEEDEEKKAKGKDEREDEKDMGDLVKNIEEVKKEEEVKEKRKNKKEGEKEEEEEKKASGNGKREDEKEESKSKTEEEEKEEKDKAKDLQIIEEDMKKAVKEEFENEDDLTGKIKIGKGLINKNVQANESQKPWILKEFINSDGENKLKNLYKSVIENPQNFNEKKILDVVVYLNLLTKRFEVLKYLRKFPQVFEILFPGEDEGNEKNGDKLVAKLERTWEYKLNKDFKKKVGIKEINKIEKDLYCIMLDLIKRMNGIVELKCKVKNVKKEELLKVSLCMFRICPSFVGLRAHVGEVGIGTRSDGRSG